MLPVSFLLGYNKNMNPQVSSLLTKWDKVFKAMADNKSGPQIRKQVYLASETENPTKELGKDMRKVIKSMSQYN